VIRNTLEQTICVELLPRSQIDICVQVGLQQRCCYAQQTSAAKGVQQGIIAQNFRAECLHRAASTKQRGMNHMLICRHAPHVLVLFAVVAAACRCCKQTAARAVRASMQQRWHWQMQAYP
jgi:hypothetical protein